MVSITDRFSPSCVCLSMPATSVAGKSFSTLKQTGDDFYESESNASTSSIRIITSDTKNDACDFICKGIDVIANAFFARCYYFRYHYFLYPFIVVVLLH